jgi:hypothetical protein
MPWLREVATVAFAGAILAVGLWLLVWAFWRVDGHSDTAFEQRKDLLLVALGLMGTVTGYFFGRVPAENRAKHAEQQAESATQTSQQVSAQLQQSEADNSKMHAKINDALGTVEMVRSKLAPAAEQATAIPDLARAQAMVEVLHENLRR